MLYDELSVSLSQIFVEKERVKCWNGNDRHSSEEKLVEWI